MWHVVCVCVLLMDMWCSHVLVQASGCRKIEFAINGLGHDSLIAW